MKEFVIAKQTAEQMTEENAESFNKSGEAAMRIVKDNTDAFTEAGNASRRAVLELTKAYQELAIRNAKNLTAAMQALATVKSPTEFIELQQRLVREGVEAAVRDSQRIAQLTTAVFAAAFAPMQKEIESAQRRAQI